MNFPQAIASCFKNYATFSGRAARSEYWYWILFCILCNMITEIVDTAVFRAPYAGLFPDPHTMHPFNLTFSLIALLPTLAVLIRRMHDVNRSGWWILISFTIIGIIYPLLVWKCTKGTEGENRFGSNPLM